MSNKQERLEILHEILTQELIKQINSGEATSGILSVARQFLKDNGIEAAPGNTEMDALGSLAKLPFTDDDGIGPLN